MATKGYKWSKYTSDEDRFWSKVKKTESCWLWQAGKNPHGYGMIWWGEKRLLAHRVSWEFVHGPIASGLFLLHHCDTPACVRPEHLFLGTQKDNMRDAAKKGRTVSKNALKTHCPQGHAYTTENTHIHKNGSRRCLACARERSRGWRRRTTPDVG